jgi:hypothetical protein
MRPPVDTSAFVSNPLTDNLNANGQEITGANVVSANFVVAGTEFSHTDPLGTLGFFGAPPVLQPPALTPVAGGNPDSDAINAIIDLLQQLGLSA